MTVQSNQCSHSNSESIAICSHYEMYLLALLSSCSPSGSFLFSSLYLSLHLVLFVPLSAETLDRPIRNVRRTESIQSMSAAGLHSECVVRLYIKGLIQWNDRQCRTAISQLLGGPTRCIILQWNTTRDTLLYSRILPELVPHKNTPI